MFRLPLIFFFFSSRRKVPSRSTCFAHEKRSRTRTHNSNNNNNKKKKLSSLISSGLFCFESFPPPLYV